MNLTSETINVMKHKGWLLLCLLVPHAIAAQAPLATLDKLMQQQLAFEQATAALQQQAQQTQLDNKRLVALYQQERKALSQALTHQQQQKDDVAQQRTELLALQQQQEQRTATYQQQLEQGRQTLTLLWERLPPPLQQSLAEQKRQMDNPQSSLSEQFSAMIGLLTKLDAFNLSVSLHHGLVTYQGQPWQVEQLYLGLAQGYFRLPDGSGGGVGTATEQGWQWRDAPEYLEQINQAFAVYKGQLPVQFVRLPIGAAGEGEQ